jgi:hypothetical protein
MDSPIVSILRAAATDDRRLSLDAFNETQIRWAIETGLGPLLHHVTKHDPGAASSPFKPLLQGADLTARVLSQELLGAASEIIDACGVHGQRILLLKGISICEQYYPESHLRLMRDIDFLVDAEAYESVESTMLARDYRKDLTLPSSFYESHHHGIPLFHPGKQVWVEIHTGLVPSRLAVAQECVFASENIESQRRSSEFRGRKVDRLSNELQIVYIAAHGAKELNRVGGIIPFLDLIYLLKGTPGEIDWDRLLAWLQDSLAAAHLFVLLTWLDKFDLISVDTSILRRLSSTQASFDRLSLSIAHRLIGDYIAKGKPYGRVLTSHNLAVAWRTLLSRGSTSRKLFLLPWNVMFPPGNPSRFSPHFQLRRIKSVLGLKD